MREAILKIKNIIKKEGDLNHFRKIVSYLILKKFFILFSNLYNHHVSENSNNDFELEKTLNELKEMNETVHKIMIRKIEKLKDKLE